MPQTPSAPAFLGLTPSAYGLLAAWSDGTVAVMEQVRGGIGFTFRPLARAEHPAVHLAADTHTEGRAD